MTLYVKIGDIFNSAGKAQNVAGLLLEATPLPPVHRQNINADRHEINRPTPHISNLSCTQNMQYWVARVNEGVKLWKAKKKDSQ